MLEGWARDGLTDEQIAKNMGISAKTLWDWKNKHSNICNALKKGKENRRPDKWRDKQKEETDTTALNKLDNILKEIKDDALRSTKNGLHK